MARGGLKATAQLAAELRLAAIIRQNRVRHAISARNMSSSSPADRLPDMLRKNLRLVFVGTAASTRSAAVGHYYAHPGNRFWRAIHEAGITRAAISRANSARCCRWASALPISTNPKSGMDHQLTSGAIDVAAFRRKIENFRPRAIAFTSKKAASLFYGKPTGAIAFGRQPSREGHSKCLC